MSERPTDQVSERLAQAAALVRSALVLAGQGRLDEAKTALRRSLVLRPEQPQAQFHLGRLLAQTGDYPGAIEMLRAAVRGQPDLFDAFLVLAQVQETMGDLANAEKNYRHAVRLNPHSVAALSSLGELLGKMNRPAQSEETLQGALQLPSLTPVQASRIAHALGIALEMQGRDEEAIMAFRRALSDDPTNAQAHRELNAMLYRLGRDGEFLQSYDTAIGRLPPARASESGALLLQKGGFLLRAERFEEARECFARVAAMAPNSAGPQNGLALAFAGLGQLEPSIAAHEKSLALRPGDLMTGVNLACTLLETGDTKRALHLTGQALTQMPFNQGVLAVHELALRANDDPRAGQIADYERHVQIFDLEPPPGFSSMAEFNAALNAELDPMHRDLREHIDQTLRHGTQTATSLLGGEHPLIRALRGRIEEAVGVYIARMDERDHALVGRRRAGFAFAGSWSSRLRDCGFHTNHVHPGGWISSCYYVAVPGEVADASTKPGWIKFGEPSFKAQLRDPIRRTVQPIPGRLMLFPSYMWHGTIPFHSAAARTTIAFDAVPV